MSNWADMLDTVRDTGSLPSFFPADLSMPMVAPADLGEATAHRLVAPTDDVELRHVEGPERYTPRDVADALAEALEIDVAVDVVPPSAWQSTFIRLGFSEAAARSYSCMTGTVANGDVARPEDPLRGSTTLQDYVRAAVRASDRAR